jgi:hypothetical protein
MTLQTFLPYLDFVACARVLDSRRLGKQRVEALQILRALLVPEYGWRHHPAVLMWKGYPEALGRREKEFLNHDDHRRPNRTRAQSW